MAFELHHHTFDTPRQPRIFIPIGDSPNAGLFFDAQALSSDEDEQLALIRHREYLRRVAQLLREAGSNDHVLASRRVSVLSLSIQYVFNCPLYSSKRPSSLNPLYYTARRHPTYFHLTPPPFNRPHPRPCILRDAPRPALPIEGITHSLPSHPCHQYQRNRRIPNPLYYYYLQSSQISHVTFLFLYPLQFR
jgi:hypothetical protein